MKCLEEDTSVSERVKVTKAAVRSGAMTTERVEITAADENEFGDAESGGATS